ncbi:MAG: hypothetical protein IAF02_14315 [Anaerolineae bacterium]|nr:hypothetical protein [Anaerolineae bacterium]
MLPRTLHQIGVATVSYNRTLREWETETEQSLLSFPAGKSGEAAARWKAIELSNPALFIILKKMIANYPELQSRAWKIGELILNGHVKLVPSPPDEGLFATVKSRTRDDVTHDITFDGYHFRCTCEDFWKDNCPRIRWHSQRTCTHVAATMATRHIQQEESPYEPITTEAALPY